MVGTSSQVTTRHTTRTKGEAHNDPSALKFRPIGRFNGRSGIVVLHRDKGKATSGTTTTIGGDVRFQDFPVLCVVCSNFLRGSLCEGEQAKGKSEKNVAVYPSSKRCNEYHGVDSYVPNGMFPT